VAPTAGGLRVGGTVEMAGLDAPPDYRRAKVLVKRAMEALPDLKVEGASEWMGHRPALPDTVPVISASAKTKGLYYGYGPRSSRLDLRGNDIAPDRRYDDRQPATHRHDALPRRSLLTCNRTLGGRIKI
jgi:hypothetical protein